MKRLMVMVLFITCILLTACGSVRTPGGDKRLKADSAKRESNAKDDKKDGSKSEKHSENDDEAFDVNLSIIFEEDDFLDAEETDIYEKAAEYTGPENEWIRELYPNRTILVDGREVLMPETVSDLARMLGIEFSAYATSINDNGSTMVMGSDQHIYTIKISYSQYYQNGCPELIGDDILEYKLEGLPVGNESFTDRVSLIEDVNEYEDHDAWDELKKDTFEKGYFIESTYGNIRYVPENYMAMHLFFEGRLSPSHVDYTNSAHYNPACESFEVRFGDLTADGYDDAIIKFDGITSAVIYDFESQMIRQISDESCYFTSAKLYHQAVGVVKVIPIEEGVDNNEYEVYFYDKHGDKHLLANFKKYYSQYWYNDEKCENYEEWRDYQNIYGVSFATLCGMHEISHEEYIDIILDAAKLQEAVWKSNMKYLESGYWK